MGVELMKFVDFLELAHCFFFGKKRDENELPEDVVSVKIDYNLGDEEDKAITIKESSFDVSKIKEYEGEEIRKFEFRPQNFSQFIGQEEAKARAKTIIKKAKQSIRTHFLVDGIKGHGKTTFVN